jgi:hypothetical protein
VRYLRLAVFTVLGFVLAAGGFALFEPLVPGVLVVPVTFVTLALVEYVLEEWVWP